MDSEASKYGRKVTLLCVRLNGETMNELDNKKMYMAVMTDGAPLYNTLGEEFGDCHRMTEHLYDLNTKHYKIVPVRVTIIEEQ